MNELQQQWLASAPWETLLTVNQALCQAKQVPSQHNAKTHAPARQIWEQALSRRMTLAEALGVCRECAALTPFVFNNGNTFAAISKTLLEDDLKLMPPVEAQIIRTTVAHYVNSLVGRKELLQVLRHFETMWARARVARAVEPAAGMEQRVAN